MNTVRYKSEYKAAALELIRQSTNMVCCPSEIYFDIARTAASAEPDVDKLSKLLGKTYSVISVENGELLGLASMDKEGNIGLLFAREGKTYTKAAKALLRALERRAEKESIAILFALKTDGPDAFLRKCGYEPFDNESGGEDAVNEYQLAKKISVEYGADFTCDMVRKITLDPTKPIKIEGRVSIAPKLLFGLACFFMTLLLLFTGVYVFDGTFEQNIRVFSILYIVVGLIFIVGTALLTGYLVRGARLKKEVLSMNVTNAVITDLSTSTEYVMNPRYRRGESERRYDTVVYISFSYVYIDGNMNKRVGQFSKKYDQAAPYFYKGQELVVAYSDDKNYVLRDYTEIKRETLGGETVNVDETDEAQEIAAPRGFNDLSKYVPLYAAKRSGRYCKTLGAVFASLLILILLIFLVVSLKNVRPFWEDVLFALPFVLMLFGALGVPVIRLAAKASRAKKRYAEILDADHEIAAGKLICSVKTYKSGNKNKFMCVYKNAKGKEQIIDLPKLYVNEMIEKGNTAVTVVYNDETAEVLVRKGKFPDN